MELIDKIMAVYPEVTLVDFKDSISLRNDSDGNGDYIEKWEHPSLPKPTEAQLQEAD